LQSFIDVVAGVLLDPVSAEANPARGDLQVHRRGFNTRIAKLLAQDGETYVLPVLDKIKLLKINDQGILIAGLEMYPPKGSKGAGAVFRQTWWCVLRHVPKRGPVTVGQARKIEKAREAQKIGASMANHRARPGKACLL
jgi:hypothetical protein